MNIANRWMATSMVLGSLWTVAAAAADWPTWRHDPGRTAISPEKLPQELHLRWVRSYAPLVPAFTQVRQERIQFDLGYEPVVLGKTLFVANSHNDSVTALDTETGAERWRFYAEGPIRLAPVAWQDKLYVAGDDGQIVCLDATTGSPLWNRRASPSPRKLLGNGRLISVWPIRGGALVHEGRVYFAAGVWPFEGIFVYCLDAQTGRPHWINDRTGAMFIAHPHAALSFGGPSPLGYSLLAGNRLAVPSGRAFPAFFDLQTGELADFEFGHGGFGSRPGSWFVATDGQGRLCIDRRLNTEIHDGGQQIIGQAAPRRKPDEVLANEVTIGQSAYRIEDDIAQRITVGTREFRFDQPPSEVQGEVHTMLAADGKLFVVGRDGRIYCYGDKAGPVQRHELEPEPLPLACDAWAATAKAILKQSGRRAGYALAWGAGTGRLAEELAAQSQLHVIAVDPDAQRIDVLRRRWDAAGLYGPRIAALVGDPQDCGLPPYLAELVVTEGLDTRPAAWQQSLVTSIFRVLRPYGGTAALPLTDEQHAQLLAWSAQCGGAEVRREGRLSLLVRAGALPGAADYVGRPNADRLVRAPLGVLWFGDTFHHHKLYYQGFTAETGRGLPQGIAVAGGLLRYAVPEQEHGPNPAGLKYSDYMEMLRTQTAYRQTFTDVYTGRVLSEEEIAQAPPLREEASQPPPFNPVRVNPLTGMPEGREFLKHHGCDLWAVDYGYLLTMRSGTGGVYDLGQESGTINISGLRTGCRNSIVPGDGVLCLPSWTGNCCCNYPVRTSMALVQMPPEFEQWTAWGGVAVEAPIRRVGINFGAPGDRIAENGTLWLDWPSVGGPSPEVPVQVDPAEARPFYRHALWNKGGQGWPWVVASGLRGMRSIRIQPVAKKTHVPGNAFSVRWTGAVRPRSAGEYQFHSQTDHALRLWLDDRLVLDSGKNVRRGQQKEITASATLEANRSHPVRLEYSRAKPIEEGGAQMQLLWTTPQGAKQPIPADALIAADGRPGGLTANYYEGSTATGPSVIQTDAELAFAWDNRLPEVLRRAAGPAQLVPRPFTVRLCFAEPDDLRPGQRVFSVRMQGVEVLKDLDIVAAAGGVQRGILREFPHVQIGKALQLDFLPAGTSEPLICGIELIAE